MVNEETNCRKTNKVKRTPEIALLTATNCERVRKSVRPRFQCQVSVYVLKVIIVEHQSVADDMDRAGSGLSCLFESCNAIIGVNG